MTSPQVAQARVINGRLIGAEFLDDAQTRKIFDVLDRDGEEARIVGGAVRNALLGAPVHEIDFATTATPSEVMARAAAAGLRTLPTGIEHGTVTILIRTSAFEVTTLREDVETDGRRAVVRFGREFEADARRRDFTINALSVAADGRLFDYVDGMPDLRERRIRFIGDARARIKEDYLRILRFLRFHSQFGEGEADAAALSAIVSERQGLDLLSRERVRAETLKLLTGPRAAETATLMSDLGLALQLFGGVCRLARLAAFAKREQSEGSEPDPILRLGALCLFVEEDANRLRAKLKLSNAEADRLTAVARALVGLHGRDAPPSERELREALYLNGQNLCSDVLQLTLAQTHSHDCLQKWTQALRFVREQERPEPPFSGADVLAKGIPTGRRVGAILKDLQARWIRAGFPRDAATVKRLLDEAAEAIAKRETG